MQPHRGPSFFRRALVASPSKRLPQYASLRSFSSAPPALYKLTPKRPTKVVAPAFKPVKEQLLRNFISEALQNFFEKEKILYSPPPISFSSLASEAEFLAKARELYSVGEEGFLTPAEVFKPVYGKLIREWVVRSLPMKKDKAKVKVFEVGGGSGQIASDFLSSDTSNVAPWLSSYTIIDFSSSLTRKQKEKLGDQPLFSNITSSILEWTAVEKQFSILLLLEVLDNLPHDKVIFAGKDKILETWVVTDSRGECFEQYRPLSDPLIISYLKTVEGTSFYPVSRNWSFSFSSAVSSFMGRRSSEEEEYSTRYGNHVFIPTGYFSLLQVIKKSFPNHKLLISDFNYLPSPVPGVGAPIVSRISGGKNVDSSSYLEQPGESDIFFPTDFRLVQHLYSKVVGRDLLQRSNFEFFESYLPNIGVDPTLIQNTTTRDGYNPLLTFYNNVSFAFSP
eukprot:TRINITY_DN6314_c0_g1_i1.p1 TRINITY_DN6314_c0_g1~~TRINITY_DN6314_c0_g1_i1.p1  ORF type:complete len:449 (+),score=97.84 TRINITY_DN6314_c0_g1_i1:98-1444(+)